MMAKQPLAMLMPPPVEPKVEVAVVEKLMPFVEPIERREPGVVEPRPTLPLLVTMKLVALDEPMTNCGRVPIFAVGFIEK